MIRLEHVSKTFATKSGDVHAVRDVSVHIAEGEIYGIIGFSGAGKSTLVRCINLLERPQSGKVIVDGKDLLALNAAQLRETRRKIGMIFQHFNLMRSRTVAQNVAFPLHKSGLSKAQISAKVKDLLALVDLSDKADVYPSQLSGGQKQRVAIARALANDPKVLLCDEATSALDPQTTRSILRLIRDINRKLNLTVVLITHEMAVVREICERAAVMEDGHIVEEGNIVDLFTHPQADVTRSFIATASTNGHIADLIEAGTLQAGEMMVSLKYDAASASRPLISQISRDLGIDCNIIQGNIEIVGNVPVGSLIVTMKGDASARQAALAQLEGSGVETEVITR
ncbi:MAG TPA: methionine ABC transporter ATP-binding protein [Candidatus Merdibacter merdavium]|uniref:Methionine ABC transporter ATP-binding protein n=1 Tax=Candidatus Merdibacter merdavium TaxID=2838692 RepID=A0A9D2NNW7_9FIRM|nr:methionine ABC transporter ATP-binding protein [Candidatus Merdibacter merdavium]